LQELSAGDVHETCEPEIRGNRAAWVCATNEISGWISWCLFFGSVSFGHPKEMNAVGRQAPQAMRIKIPLFCYKLQTSNCELKY
jgi:hypothetical protein